MYNNTSELVKNSRSQNADGSETGLVQNCSQKRKSMISVESFVLDIMSRIVKIPHAHGVEAKASNISIIESLAWIFLSYRSNTTKWYSTKQLRRLGKSLTKSYQNIQKFSNDMYQEYSYCKYWLDVLLCRMAKDPSLPKRQDWNTIPLFQGYCKRIIEKALSRQTKSDQMLILSLQKGSKKIWANLNEEAALQKDADFKARLCTEKGTVSRTMKRYLINCSEEVFHDLMENQITLTGAIPSHRACWQSSVKKNGAQGLFSPLRIPLSIAPPPMFPDLENSRPGFSIRRTENPNSLQLDPSPPESIVERNLSFGKLRGLDLTLQKWLQNTFDKAYEHSLDQMYQDLYSCSEYDRRRSRLEEDILRSLPSATTNRVARITEAGGKIRYVSCGDGYIYTALRPLQKAMLKCWKRTTFSTMLQDDLLDEVRRIDSAIKLPYWCSVDYEAATDLLKRDASFRVLEPLLRRNVKLSDLAWESFGPGVMIMPDKSEFVHVEGQLMGHVLSFPMLCCINLAVYYATVDRWTEENPDFIENWGDGFLPRSEIRLLLYKNVKINGDDMLFKCTKSMYETFLQVCQEVGFKISQGKNYLSRDFCMINSQFYCRHGGIMERVGYLNLQLVKGISSKKGESSATPADIGESLNKMILHCPWAQSTIPAALKAAEQKLGKVSDSHRPIGMNRSWFGSRDLGGYGVNPIYANNFQPTREQRKLGAMMKSMPWIPSYLQTKVQPRMMNLINSIIHPIPTFVQGPPTEDGIFPKYQPVDPSRIPTILPTEDLSLIEMKDSKWFSRLLFYGQASAPPFEGDLPAKLLNSLPNDHRLKPMSVRKYINYRSPVMLVSQGPDCPPLSPLLIKKPSVCMYTKSDESFQYFEDRARNYFGRDSQ